MGGPPAAFRRHRRGGHERPGDHRPRSGRRGDRLRSRRVQLHGASARAGDHAGHRPSRGQRPAGRRGRVLDGGAAREPRARRRPARAAPRRPAGRDRPAAPLSGGDRHPRQDDDHGDGRPRAPGRRPGSVLRRGRGAALDGRQRGLGERGVDRDRGRRIRPLAAQARPRDRDPHQRRARSPLHLWVAPGSGVRRSPSSWPGPRRGRSSGIVRRCGRSAREAACPTTLPAYSCTPAARALRGGGSRSSSPWRAPTTPSMRPGRSPPARWPERTRRPAARALADFRGARRRMERLGESAAGAQVYDDYAHHPTEVAATLAGARSMQPRRVVGVFQPHLYSRTRALARAFGAALAGADVAVVLGIYPARESAEDFPGVSGRQIAESVPPTPRRGGRLPGCPGSRRPAPFSRHPARRRPVPDDGRGGRRRAGSLAGRRLRARGAGPIRRRLSIYPGLGGHPSCPTACSATFRWPA